MNIEIKEQNGTYVGILSGWLDTNESSQFIEDLKVLEENIDKPIVLDCKNLEYICSLALRGLLKLKKESAAKGGRLVVLSNYSTSNNPLPHLLQYDHDCERVSLFTSYSNLS